MGVKHIWSVLASKAVIDQQSNSISIFDAVEQVTVSGKNNNGQNVSEIKGKKNIPVNLVLATLWQKENLNSAINIDTKIELIDPSGEVVMHGEAGLHIPADKKRMRNIGQIGNLAITSEGMYWLKLLAKSKNKKAFDAVASLPIEVAFEK